MSAGSFTMSNDTITGAEGGGLSEGSANVTTSGNTITNSVRL